jgi:hypothetical protein
VSPADKTKGADSKELAPFALYIAILPLGAIKDKKKKLIISQRFPSKHRDSVRAYVSRNAGRILHAYVYKPLFSNLKEI